MTTRRSRAELDKMREACVVVAETLSALEAAIGPGMKTKELDKIAHDRIIKAGARPAFLGYRDYPASVCVSVNDEVIHGIPGERKLRDGDIVSLDLGAVVDGYYGDGARSVGVGQISDKARRLLEVTEASLMRGIEMCHPGKRVGDIGHAVEQHARENGFSVVREFVGHGIGTSLHEEPQVPNYGPPGRRERLLPGMCLAIEPMVNVGRPEVRTLDDGWTAVTVDGSLSAHFELTVAIMEEGPWILAQPYPFGDGSAVHA